MAFSGCRTGGIAIALVVSAAIVAAAHAQTPNVTAAPALQTNQAYVDEVTRSTQLNLDDPLSVFAFVLDHLPDRVKVYPTENYYYFRFFHDGVRYGGDIRLDAMDRDQGRIHFGYYQKLNGWKHEGEGADKEVVLGKAQGVTVEKLAPLIYRIGYRGKRVTFALNDLSKVRPPASAMAPGEKFFGPIFDESAIRFFLIFDTRLKIFHYILDETAPVPDRFVATRQVKRIIIGQRTGFAFYRDLRRPRKILIGVYADNADWNNYLDGPFDQMPDNFIAGDTLRQAMVARDPTVKGEIDRLGHFHDGSGRFLIQPFKLYRKESDLYPIDRCARRERNRPDYGRCFVTDVGPEGTGPGDAVQRQTGPGP